MKPLFYGLTIAACIGACVFSLKLKTNFLDQQDKKNASIKDTKATEVLSKTESDKLNKEAETLRLAKESQATLEESIATLNATANTLKRDIVALDGKLDEQKAKFAELARVQQQIQDILKNIPGGGSDVNLENLADKVKEIEAKRDAQKKELEELLTNVEGAKKNVADNQSEISRLGDHEVERAARFRHNSMESVVTAVNSDWGFIVIGAGSNTGFTPQTKLLVEREGRLIGEVKPSAIEPSQTIAEIDLDTIAPGARIQPGDRVILSEPATN
jgi:predicted RNase H-like nuclease (RuvC/YqgF family)